MHETIYEDKEGRLILVIDLLDAYGMVNKAVKEEHAISDDESKAYLEELRKNFDAESAALRLHIWSQKKKA
jgi:aminopeptidase C